jgi:hypothetical protein
MEIGILIFAILTAVSINEVINQIIEKIDRERNWRKIHG